MTPFGRTPDGHDARLFTLRSRAGLRAEISDYGGTIVRLFAPDRQGRHDDVVLGFDTLAEYVDRSPHFGCVVGRCGNRIAGATFTLDGRIHRLATNNSPGGRPCHLHGGLRGFDKLTWAAEPGTEAGQDALRLRLRSPDGDEAYPGTLDVVMTYTLTDDNALRIDYEASTDQPTPVNLTHHSYFNLAGAGRGDVLDHTLTLNARAFTPVDAGLIPTGQVEPVADTPFDFTTPHRIGERIDADDEQLHLAGGYDHNFVLEPPAGADGLVHAATVVEPASGRRLAVETTEPGVQLYTGNFLTGSLLGKSGRRYAHRGGFCLETQHFPDSPNQPSFPSVILRPGRILRSTTMYRFDTV
jgi:aldose 1-epimerase